MRYDAITVWRSRLARLALVLAVVLSPLVSASQPLPVADAARTGRAPAAAPATLFDGTITPDWLPVGVAGGDFAAFAHPAPGLLAVDVPAGQGWGKTGIRSAEPVVGAAARPDGLLFRFDADRTDAFVIALADNPGEDDWSSHVLRLHWYPRPEGGGVAVMFHRQRTVWRQVFPDIAAPDEIALTLDAAGAAAFVMPGGIRMETPLEPLPPQGYRLIVLAHPADANLPARMALRGIDRIADPATVVAPPVWPSRPGEAVLFDGTLGRAWMPVSLSGGDFARDATVGPGGLQVIIPPGLGWAAAGIHSAQPALWLDDFTDGAEIVIEAALDPMATGSFVFALSASGSPGYPQGPQWPNLVVQRFAATADTPAHYQIHLEPHRDGDFLDIPAPADPPSRLTIRLRPGEAFVELPGIAPIVRPWPDLVEGQGLRIVGYAFQPALDAGTALALTQITTRRADTDGSPAATGPAPGVAPLPMQVVFDGLIAPAWEPVGLAGGDFAAFATPSPDGLRIDVPEGNSWGKTGLLSTAPLVTLDALSSRTPTRIDIALDPDVANTFNLALSGDRTPEMWLSHLAWYTLMPDPRRDVWHLGLHHGTTAEWSREIDGSWMRDNWNGHVWIDVAQGWTRISLPDGPALRAPVAFSAPQAHFATILAHAPREDAAARLALQGVTVGRLTPDGMTALDRWELVDDTAFDPAAYLLDLADAESLP